jgi:hypothetical protein
MIFLKKYKNPYNTKNTSLFFCMQNTLFTLKNKRNLTSDVFLLEFETKESLDFIA